MRILLIDNEIGVIKSLKDSIEPAGHDCILAQNPKKALTLFTKEKFDVVITDYKMPQMNGIEVLKSIKEYKKETPVIMFTAFADVDNAIDALNNGAYAFFRKPFDLKDLLNTLMKIEEEKMYVQKKEINHRTFVVEYYKLKMTYDNLLDIVQKHPSLAREIKNNNGY